MCPLYTPSAGVFRLRLLWQRDVVYTALLLRLLGSRWSQPVAPTPVGVQHRMRETGRLMRLPSQSGDPPRRAPDEADGASAVLLCRDAVYCWPGAGFCGPVWPGGFCNGACPGFGWSGW